MKPASVMLLVGLFGLVAGLPVQGRAQLNPIQLENQLPGSSGWPFDGPVADDARVQTEGYTDRSSATHGESLDFFVSSGSPPQTYDVQVYRMGWYGGLGGRLVHARSAVAGISQPSCSVYTDSGTRTSTATGQIECNWSPCFGLVLAESGLVPPSCGPVSHFRASTQSGLRPPTVYLASLYERIHGPARSDRRRSIQHRFPFFRNGNAKEGAR